MSRVWPVNAYFLLWGGALRDDTKNGWEGEYPKLRLLLVNNIELKCSLVWCRKYHKSWSNGEPHISVDLLCGTTATELHNSVDLRCDTTAAELHNSVNLLCGLTTAAELHNSVDLLFDTKTAELNLVWRMHLETHTFSKDSDEPCWKIWRLNPK